MAPTPRIDDQLCFAVYAASRAISKAYQPMLARLGLTYPQFLVMMVLWEEDDRTVSELGDRLMLDSGTLTPLLKRMARDGLITRHRDPQDERRVRSRLTDRGRALAPQASVEHAAWLCALADADGDLVALAALRDELRALVARMGGG